MINEKIVPISPYGFRFPTETEMAIDETLKLCGISGEEASMMFIEVMKKLGKNDNFSACCRSRAESGTDDGDDSESSQPEQRWIPVSERLPKKDGRYQVTRYDDVTKTEFIDILWYEENLWWNRRFTGDYAVTAWMPLLKPWKMDEVEE